MTYARECWLENNTSYFAIFYIFRSSYNDGIKSFRPPVTEMQVTASYEQAKEANDVFFLYVGPDNTPVKDNFAKAAKALFTRLSFYSIEHYKLPAVSSSFHLL